MPSVLGSNLVDSLVPAIDEIRGTIHPALGTRQYRVFTVKRTWSGARRGEGSPSYVVTEILPQPKLTDGSRNEMGPGGLEEEGQATLTEVSLSYAESDLYQPALTDSQEFYYRVTDAQGQGLGARYYVPSAPPTADRDGDVAWRIQLRLVEVQE